MIMAASETFDLCSLVRNGMKTNFSGNEMHAWDPHQHLQTFQITLKLKGSTYSVLGPE